MTDEPPGWAELFGDALPEDSDDPDPLPGERLLYALAQLYRLHLRRRLPIHPDGFDIEDLARIIGVADALEFVSEDRNGTHLHFPAEVLHVNCLQPFPWRLLTIWEWAAEQEHNAFWAEGGD